MGSAVTFNAEKAHEALLYVVGKQPNLYSVLKIIFFADLDHLERYGRLIYGDHYIAMRYGPVPSEAFHIVQIAKGEDVPQCGCSDVQGEILVDSNTITPLREADLEHLSETDIECLDRAVAQYGSMGFDELRKLSHQHPAYIAANRDDTIPLQALIDSLPNSTQVRAYLNLE